MSLNHWERTLRRTRALPSHNRYSRKAKECVATEEVGGGTGAFHGVLIAVRLLQRFLAVME